MSRCETGKNRMKALLPNGTPVEHKTGTLNGLADDVGFITLPDGRRIAIAIFTRGGSDRPRTIAEAARTIYDGFAKVLIWPFGSSLDRTASAPAHRRPGQDRPLARGRSRRTLSETHRLADQGDRACRPRRQAPAPAANGITVVLDERGKALSSTELARALEGWRDSRQARGALPDRRRRRA